MLLTMAAVVAAVCLLAAGWWASAWHHQRQNRQLQLQLRVTRQTANAHYDQARRQIGQLQAELARRPPAPPQPDRDDALAEGMRRRPAVPDRFVVLEDGFPQTAVIGDGFAPTQLTR